MLAFASKNMHVQILTSRHVPVGAMVRGGGKSLHVIGLGVGGGYIDSSGCRWTTYPGVI